MKIVKTSDFNQSFKKLPKEIQKLCLMQEKRFLINWKDSRLHIKKVQSLGNVLSLRITSRYRAFFFFQNSLTVIFFEIDHRKDIYKKI